MESGAWELMLKLSKPPLVGPAGLAWYIGCTIIEGGPLEVGVDVLPGTGGGTLISGGLGRLFNGGRGKEGAPGGPSIDGMPGAGI